MTLVSKIPHLASIEDLGGLNPRPMILVLDLASLGPDIGTVLWMISSIVKTKSNPPLKSWPLTAMSNLTVS